MKSVHHKENSQNFKLLIGLTYALAASLCMLEYGRPLMDQLKWKGEIGEKIDYVEAPVRITLPKPPTKMETKPEVNKVSEVFKVVPNEVVIEKLNEPLVEIQPEIDFAIPGDSIAAPDIEIPPLPGYQLDQLPDCTSLMNHLGKNVRFPKRMRDVGSNGAVYMEFVLRPDGKLDKESYKVLRSAHPDFTKEVVRVLESAPACVPGYKLGKPVPVIMQVPVRFNLK